MAIEPWDESIQHGVLQQPRLNGEWDVLNTSQSLRGRVCSEYVRSPFQVVGPPLARDWPSQARYRKAFSPKGAYDVPVCPIDQWKYWKGLLRVV